LKIDTILLQGEESREKEIVKEIIEIIEIIEKDKKKDHLQRKKQIL
jgi:hypothetical protein